MADFNSATAQKLMNTFMQFRKTGWHEKKISGYNPSEFKVLAAIQRGMDEDGAMKVSEISRALHVTPPTVTQIINILEKDGLAERSVDPEDRRAVRVKLTNRGIEAADQARQAFRETFLGLIDFLGEEDSSQLADLLAKVNEYFINRK